MRRQIARWLAAALMLLPLITVVGIGDAEAGTTLTGTIRGVVADENGEPLPGVTIIFRSESLVRERAALTDADGNFFVPGLAPGFYTVVAQLDGFQTVQQNTEVIVDETTRLDFALKAGEITETVTVVATKPVVDKTATDTGVVLDKKFTENIPTARSYQSLLQFAPGVTGGSNPNMLGGTSNSNTYQVDGVSITDSVTGTFGANINFDTIEAVDVKLSGVSAEYGGFQGGLSNVITKSGGNDFTGSIRDEIDSPSFETDYDQSTQDEFAPGTTPPPIPPKGDKALSHDIQGAFGGPIVRDSAWFYVSYSRDDTVGLQFLANPVGGPQGDGTYLRTFQGDNSLGKLTWQVVNNHKLQYTYSEDPASVPRCYGQLFFGGPCYDSFNVDFQNQGGFFWTGNWNGIWGNRALSDLKISHWENGFLLGPLTPQPINPGVIFESPGGLGSGLAAGPPATVDLSTGVTFDGTIFSNDPSQRLRDQYEAKGTFFFDTGLGSHTLKVGADYQEQTRIGSSIISGNALIYMLDDNGDGTGFVNAPPGLGGTGDPYDVNNREYFLWYDFAPPGTGGPTTETTAIYVQDDWQLNENWSFNLGIRFEQNDNTNDIGEAVIDDQGIAPRLGASWDVTGEGKYVVKATAGRYLDGIELTTLSPFVRAAGGQSAYDLYLNVGAAGGAPPTWALIAQVRPDVDTSGFSDDLKPQYIDEVTLGYEHSFTPTFAMGIRGIAREWSDIIGQSFTYDYSTGVARQLLLFDNQDFLERDYTAAIVTVEKRFSNNWELLANYTYSESNGNVTTDSGFATTGAFRCDPLVTGCTSDGFVPQTINNRDGELAWSINNSFNVQGSYRIPLNSRRHNLTVGARANFRDGNRYSQTENTNVIVGPGPNGVQEDPIGSTTVTVDDQTAQITTFYEERGIRREPNVWRLDTQLKWLFSFNRKVSMESRIEVFNITNEQRPASVNTGFPSSTFGYPNSYSQFQTPRNYRFNFAILW